MKIPKIIHYFYDDTNIWEKNHASQVRMCLLSWLQKCPEYKIVKWTDNSPEFKTIINQSNFIKRAYKLKLWAFVADYLRLYVLYKYGGIYLDTDVQLLNNFDSFLNKKFFISIEGDIRYGENIPEPAIIGSIPGHNLLKKCMSIYETNEILKIDEFIANNIMKRCLTDLYNFHIINFTNPQRLSLKNFFNKKIPIKKISNFELYTSEQMWEDSKKTISIYPSEYFCPCWESFKEKSITSNTISIHWNQSSWHNDYKIYLLKNFNINIEKINIENLENSKLNFNMCLRYVLSKIFSLKTYTKYFLKKDKKLNSF